MVCDLGAGPPGLLQRMWNEPVLGAAHQDATGIVAGSLDQPTRLVRIGQVFTAEKADFVDLAEGVPTFAGSSAGALDNDHV